VPSRSGAALTSMGNSALENETSKEGTGITGKLPKVTGGAAAAAMASETENATQRSVLPEENDGKTEAQTDSVPTTGTESLPADEQAGTVASPKLQ